MEHNIFFDFFLIKKIYHLNQNLCWKITLSWILKVTLSKEQCFDKNIWDFLYKDLYMAIFVSDGSRCTFTLWSCHFRKTEIKQFFFKMWNKIKIICKLAVYNLYWSICSDFHIKCTPTTVMYKHISRSLPYKMVARYKN